MSQRSGGAGRARRLHGSLQEIRLVVDIRRIK
jgi:hypothetical protein